MQVEAKDDPARMINSPAQAVRRPVRDWIALGALLLLSAVLLLIYYKTVAASPPTPDALDYAQVGRNVATGRGFTTLILRPLAMSHGGSSLAQQDVTHGPIFPLALAAAFGIFGAKDSAAALVSCLFYLLTILAVYLLGRRTFTPLVGTISAAAFAISAVIVEYAASGTPITLEIFLTTCLMLSTFECARVVPTEARVSRAAGPFVAAGVLSGLLYLTDPIFVWLLPGLAAALFAARATRTPRAVAAFAAAYALLALPWMTRNGLLTGNPIFGLRGMEFWMNTPHYYPGLSAYRLMPPEITIAGGVTGPLAAKFGVELTRIVQVLPSLPANWILAFFLPGMFFRFGAPALGATRGALLLCMAGLVAGSLALHLELPQFTSLVPAMLVFATAYLLHVVRQARLSPASTHLAAVVFGAALITPLAGKIVFGDRSSASPEASAARAMPALMSAPGDVALSDQPWLVAWYSNRPAVWIPVNDSAITTVRHRFPEARWLFLTREARNYSVEWQGLYDVMAQWNAGYAQAASAGAAPSPLTLANDAVPLVAQLHGFQSVPPPAYGSPVVVVAVHPSEGAAGSKKQR